VTNLVLVRRRAFKERILRWTLPFLRASRGPVAALGALSFAEIALRAVAPWPLKAIVDHLLTATATPVPGISTLLGTTARVPVLFTVVVTGFALQIGHQLVLMLHTRLQTRVAQRMVFDLRSRLFEHLQYLSLAHHQKGSTADAVYRLETDAGCLEALVLRGLFPLVFSVLTLVVMFVVLLRLDPALAVVSMIVVPFLYASLRIYVRRMEPRARRAKALESAVVGRFFESLSAIRLVKTFGREQHELSRFSGIAAEAMRERLSVVKHESFFAFMVGTITLCGSSLVLAIGGLHVIDGRISIGTLLVIIAYLGFVYGPLSTIATTTGSLQHARASARRVGEVLALPREGTDEAGAIEPMRFRGAVRFEDVTFSYGPGRPVLNHVSFEAKPGETIALVGLSGAGKSTLVSLLGRFYEATSGRVVIDNLDVRRMKLKALRDQIAVVLQDSIMFPGSIGENILYGRLDATDHEVVLAARAANCEEFVADMRRGFDTPLGDAGAGLSGGQQQRVSIARAFLKDAPILILDEPTMALDTLSEQAILRALTELRQGRTTFVIAHRLSSVRDADRILVMHAGGIVAQGRHEELLASCELYQQLCQRLLDAHGAARAAGVPR
jgi:ATP-binding cassette subfamily B protein/subfamily B ATP-binding cassette protein MsbA